MSANRKVVVASAEKQEILSNEEEKELSGEPPGNRTQNLLIKSQLLCQLS